LKEISSAIDLTPTARRVVFENFERSVRNPRIGSEAMTLIQRLLAVNATVVLVSRTEPFVYDWGESSSNGQGASGSALQDRWAELTGQLKKVYFTESCCRDDFESVLLEKESEVAKNSDLTRSQRKRGQRAIDVIRAECNPRLALRRIGKEILKRLNLEQARPADIRSQIGNQARLYYQRIWKNLSDDERLTLIHLAEDRLLSPNDPAINQLILKGLIVRSPDVRLLNETFRDYVLRYCFTGNLASIESQAKQMSPWEKLKLPLLVGLTAVVLFLVITQREFFGSSLSIITGFTSSIPAVFKLLSFFQSQGGQKMLSSAATPLTGKTSLS
jgi:hypothetical protein